MTPRWIVDKRAATCISCERQIGCQGKYSILAETPSCPLGLLANTADEIAARAWPSGAAPVSGCCDSAKNYLSQGHSV